jgi:ABC-type nitrate/sulfonate/bicarbonate transport system substrate-binding protein
LALAVAVAVVGTAGLPRGSRAEAAGTTVRVISPEADNLQYLSFWVALGAGYFQNEGLDVRVVVPPTPAGAAEGLLQGQAEVAILPPPLYLELIARRQPILIFANLLQNDPIDLVVRREVLEARNLSPTAPLQERLKGLRGLRVGVAPGPPTRLRALFYSVGLDIDRDIEAVVIPGPQQNRAFEQGRVDALYAHTPYLEKALADQGAVLLVNQSAGEVPELSGRQIHSLVATRRFVATNPEAILGLTRAIYRAQQLLHADLGAATEALMRSGVPGLERRLVDTLLPIYQPAVPGTPEVTVGGVAQAYRLFPESRTPPDISGIDLADYLAPEFAQRAVAEAPGRAWPAPSPLAVAGSAADMAALAAAKATADLLAR